MDCFELIIKLSINFSIFSQHKERYQKMDVGQNSGGGDVHCSKFMSSCIEIITIHFLRGGFFSDIVLLILTRSHMYILL